MVTKKKTVVDKEDKPKKKFTPKKETTQQVKMKAILVNEKGEETEIEKADGPPITIVEQMANVGYSYGETINTGNYNNRKFQISLHVPCYTNEIGKVKKAIVKKVSEWAEELRDDIEKDI